MDTGLVGLEAVFLGEYFLAYAIGIVLHEAGHAVAGWALDCHPRIVEIGWGRPVFRCRLADAWLVIRLLPVSGMVYLLPRGRERVRASFMVTAAGPLANIVLATAAFVPMARQGFSTEAIAAGFPWLFAQLWILLLVLSPYTYAKQGARFATDGYKLWRYMTYRGDEYLEMHRKALRTVMPDGVPLPPPSRWYPELVVQAVRRDRLKERWAREDAVASVRVILGQDDLPAGERSLARNFLAALEGTAQAPEIVRAAAI